MSEGSAESARPLFDGPVPGLPGAGAYPRSLGTFGERLTFFAWSGHQSEGFWISAVVLSFTEPITLPPEGPSSVARLTIQANVPETLGVTTTARVTFQDGCREAGGPISNVITHQGSARNPERTACELEIVAGAPRFRRGDANTDGAVDLSDALAILGRLFLGEGVLHCRDAADSNDSGLLDVSDAVHVLNFLFLGGEPPAPPGPSDCGPDPTDDDALPPCRYDACGED